MPSSDLHVFSGRLHVGLAYDCHLLSCAAVAIHSVLCSTGMQPFENILEELQYFFCEVGVHGIFSESVDAAVLASSLPCPEAGGKRSKGVSENVCFQGTASTQSFATFTAFMMGIIITLLAIYFIQGRKLRSGRQERVPTEDVDENVQQKASTGIDDSELPNEDMEML